MPGHKLLQTQMKDASLFEKYQCPHCNLLLKDALQSVCGHWLCASCASEHSTPICPQPECQEDLVSNAKGGVEIFPDRFVRKEINGMIVYCPNQQKGCNWEDRLDKLKAHLETCDFTSEECPQCGTILTPEQVESHKQTCPKAMVKCPLADFGCSHKLPILREELEQHIQDHGIKHLYIIASILTILRAEKQTVVNLEKNISTDTDLSLACSANSVDKDGPSYTPGSKQPSEIRPVLRNPYEHGYNSSISGVGRLPDEDRLYTAVVATTVNKMKGEIDTRLVAELHHRDEEIAALKSTISKMEKSMTSKHAELDERDFRLSLIENSNYDGTIIWKIPQFSQRMSDAQTGKYTSIFSLPFYTGRYGYKMCLRLYVLGDGIGKNSHMSIFFVVMKGEFDNILQWPFTHKVTFKMINQTGGRDIIDTFQPDPMSSSFRKPKSDMNIASGCPRFVSHTELKSGGFIEEDTIFIKCSVDCSAIKNV